jgi:hypothetical protein
MPIRLVEKTPRVADPVGLPRNDRATAVEAGVNTVGGVRGGEPTVDAIDTDLGGGMTKPLTISGATMIGSTITPGATAVINGSVIISARILPKCPSALLVTNGTLASDKSPRATANEENGVSDMPPTWKD